MATGWSVWNEAELSFMQQHINALHTYESVCEQFKTKFGKTVTKSVIAALTFRGKLKAPTVKRCRPNKSVGLERHKLIIALCDEGWTVAQIVRQCGQSDHTVRKHLRLAKKQARSGRNKVIVSNIKRVRAPAVHSGDDPIADIGFSIVDLRANGCRFPVARTPETLVRRFCGDARMMDGGKFISAYCPKHHITTHRQQPVCEAAE